MLVLVDNPMSMPPFAPDGFGGNKGPALFHTEDETVEEVNVSSSGEPFRNTESHSPASRLGNRSGLSSSEFSASIGGKRSASSSEDSPSAKRFRAEAEDATRSLLLGDSSRSAPAPLADPYSLITGRNSGLGTNTDQTASLLLGQRLRADMEARLLREQASRNAAMSGLLRQNISAYMPESLHGGLGLGSTLASNRGALGSLMSPLQNEQFARLRHLAELDALRRTSGFYGLYPPVPSALSFGQVDSFSERAGLPSLLRHASMPGPFPIGQVANLPGSAGMSNLLRHASTPLSAPTAQNDLDDLEQVVAAAERSQLESGSTAIPAPAQDAPVATSTLNIPPCEEEDVLSAPFFKRTCFPLSTPEDPNWLSEFHCFVRSDLIEVFRAGKEHVRTRKNIIFNEQVGLRCRYCAHMPPSTRSGRSAAFPSSLRQIYQSFTMMLRDHFSYCENIPSQTRERLAVLKSTPSQGATDSKRFWIYAAKKIGLKDSPDGSKGIVFDANSKISADLEPPYGTPQDDNSLDGVLSAIPLVVASDRTITCDFLFTLLSQVQIVHLAEVERIGNRRSLEVGLPGLGCRFCCEQKRYGLSRVFPPRRRILPDKVKDMHDHMRRCTLCPSGIKERLENTKHQLNKTFDADQGDDRVFLDKVWSRLCSVKDNRSASTIAR